MQFINIEQLSKTLIKRNEILKRLENMVNKKGYIKVEPDYFEPYDRFTHMNKRIKKESMIKIFNQDGSISILRPDITTNIIKQIIPKWNNANELKVYYIASTFRQSLAAPLMETRQFGVEYLGQSSCADQDLIELILSIFASFRLNFILVVSHQSFLNALFKQLNLSDDKENELKQLIDYKNQDGIDQFIQKNEIKSQDSLLLTHILSLQGTLDDVIQRLQSFHLSQEMIDSIDILKKLKCDLKNQTFSHLITFDLSLISTFDYYNGVTFKGYMEGISDPIINGGRYDTLTKEFGKEVPATGFSLNLTELIKEVLSHE